MTRRAPRDTAHADARHPGDRRRAVLPVDLQDAPPAFLLAGTPAEGAEPAPPAEPRPSPAVGGVEGSGPRSRAHLPPACSSAAEPAETSLHPCCPCLRRCCSSPCAVRASLWIVSCVSVRPPAHRMRVFACMRAFSVALRADAHHGITPPQAEIAVCQLGKGTETNHRTLFKRPPPAALQMRPFNPEHHSLTTV